MWGLESPQWISGGAINIASFVSQLGNFTCVQTTGPSTAIVGVAQQGQRNPPGVVGSTANQAATASGQLLAVQQTGEVCRLHLGGTAVTGGQFLTADINGFGIPASDGNYVGAMALESGNAAETIRVVVLPPGTQYFAGGEVSTVRTSVSLTPVGVTSLTSAEQIFAVSGLLPNMQVSVSPPGSQAGVVMGGCRVTGAGSLGITFGNCTGTSLNPPSGLYQVTAFA